MTMKHSETSSLIVLSLLALAVTLPFITQEQIRDSLFWAKVINDGKDLYSLLNPHHLIYLPINLLVHKLIGPFCPVCDGIGVGMIHSMLAYILSVTGIYLLVREFSTFRPLAWLAALLLLFAEVPWVYSMQVSPYIPMLASLAWLALITTRIEHRGVTPARLLAMGGLLALTILYHQAAVVLSIPILLFFLRRDGLRPAMAVLCGAGALVLAAYLVAYALLESHWSFASLLAFSQRYSTIPIPTFSTFSNYTWSNFALLLQLHIEGLALPPWRLRTLYKAAFMIGVLVLFAWHAYAIVRGRRLAAFRLFSLSWLILLFAVYLWANPTEKEYFSIDYTPLIALLFLSLADLSETRKRAFQVSMIAILLFIAYAAWQNFTTVIQPMSAGKGKNYFIARDMAAVAPGNCLVIHEDQLVQQNVNYYFGYRTRDLWDIMNYYFYAQGRPIPFTWLNFSFNEAACYIIPARTILPEANVSGNSGYERPQQWLDFTRWLFGIASDGNSATRMYQVRSLRDANDRLYFMVVPKPVTLPLGTDWASYLDQAMVEATGKPMQSYSTWARKFPTLSSTGLLQGHPTLPGGYR